MSGINSFLFVRTVSRYEKKTVQITVGLYGISKAFFHQVAVVVHYLLTYPVEQSPS